MAVRVFLFLCAAGICFLLYVLVCFVREGKQDAPRDQALRRKIRREIREENQENVGRG